MSLPASSPVLSAQASEPTVPFLPTQNPNQALWEKGDFTAIATFMRRSGAAVVEALDVKPPLYALDLGCGDGTTAVPLAQRGAHVLGVDIARNLVAAGERRAAEAGLSERLRFQHGDACNLEGLPDAAFDLTLTMFGAMFAPRPADVARELARVTRPGGLIVMGNWIPQDPTSFVSQLLRISAEYTPPPPAGFVSPILWGVEAHVLERFAQAGIGPERISFERSVFTFVTERDAEHIVETFRRFYAPTMNAYEAAGKTGRTEELHRDLLALARSQSRATAGGIEIPATYLKVTVRR